ncbi:phosphotransferase [Peribacillus cavernae]|uniref:Phosphotransferase n=1 Tax=Peribacillus cavernae TaxID=1674310 RepID=A0A433HUF5_9BACI|nr:phosphotransferase family protein [Peribacillus cavernae]MDQ0220308.1 thiamine kinase-like enzyme [Peribacillus cavernae]RUQ31966.1 phosphotransferase [Peribacillus cavernae]
MEHLLGQEWEIVPAGGATGEAFIALKDKEQKLFLKRNTSPFLAVLSAEGIVPKLVWTKRLENGDVITAQHWLNGRELSHQEMNEEQVAKLLQKIHKSEPLLSMLKRLGKSPLRPESILTQIETSLDQDVVKIPAVNQAVAFLQNHILLVECDELVVCHGDVNHNNWLISDEEALFLIDWDGAIIADPAIDLGVLLHSYIPKKDWRAWLGRYGRTLDAGLEMRMKWHVIAQALSSIQWHKDKNRLEEMDRLVQHIHSILQDDQES